MRQCEAMEQLRKKEWMEKEILLDQVIKNEISWHERRQEVLKELADRPDAEESKYEVKTYFLRLMGVDPVRKLYSYRHLD